MYLPVHQLFVYLLLDFLLLLLFYIFLLTPDEKFLSKALVFDCSLCFVVNFKKLFVRPYR